MAEDVFFRVSSGLKSIIGRELITDDFIAVFELVKNSFDATATRVDITFENLGTPEALLTIKDNGKGMSKADIFEKWLFVAYSAKKEGTEDYRNKISQPRVYAGAKGIGRFSCDKLGGELELISRPKDGGLSRLIVDWSQFERNAEDEFIKIPANFASIRSAPDGFDHGTILKISNLREHWDRDKFIKLRRSLEKLINPTQSNTARAFRVYLHVDSEKRNDTSEEKVNGEIKNFVFEKLKIKTTYIHVKASEDTITTRLVDRDRYVYEIVESNPYSISNIEIHLFALNQSAKLTFTKTMGVPSVRFGSVFLFKNGFRVYPYGEEGEDPWGIDVRKQQGQSRFLGTRDLIGRVEINGNDPRFTESTSRDGGLVRSPAVNELKAFFFEFAIKRLERYAVDVIKWGAIELESGEAKSKALELILGLTRSKKLLSVEYNPELIDIINEASEKSLKSLISSFRDVAESTNNPQLEKDAKKAERRIRQLERAKNEAEEESEQASKEKDEAVKEAVKQKKIAKKIASQKRKVESQNLFLQSMVSSDVENLIGLHHHIGISAATIKNYVKTIVKRINSGKPVSADMFVDTLDKISMQASQIESASRFATKANFSLDAAQITDDILGFVREYIQNVCKGLVYTTNNNEMHFSWKNNSNLTEFVISFRPFEVVVLIDNMVNNARKANATKIDWTVDNLDGTVAIHICDNGKGVKSSLAEKIFESGFTTTSGSGFGLYHARRIAESMQGNLKLNIDNKNETEFVWEIK